MTTLIILNPHAGSGRAGKLWTEIEPMLWKELGELVVAVTQRPEDVAPHLEQARAAGLTRVIAIGGDGTNHALINALIKLNQQHPEGPMMTFGNLPMGTGQDWARTMGIPFKPADAVRWIKGAHSTPLDVGQMQLKGDIQNFLNIASVGISGTIAGNVNRVKNRRPWTFYKSTVEALIKMRPPQMTVRLDGKLWYEGKSYITAIANGQQFGHGMKVAPNARYDDGLFDVILVEGVSRTRILSVLNTVYSGTHLQCPEVHEARAKVVEIESAGDELGMELDGEPTTGHQMRFEVLPSILKTLARSEDGKQA
jgi:diacylglycerol kinase (ATP)